MYAMAYGYLPFESELSFRSNGNTANNNSRSIIWTPSNVYQLYQHVASNPLVLPRLPTERLDRYGQDLLLKLLESSPGQRLTMEQLWRHPWLAGETK